MYSGPSHYGGSYSASFPPNQSFWDGNSTPHTEDSRNFSPLSYFPANQRGYYQGYQNFSVTPKARRDRPGQRTGPTTFSESSTSGVKVHKQKTTTIGESLFPRFPFEVKGEDDVHLDLNHIRAADGSIDIGLLKLELALQLSVRRQNEAAASSSDSSPRFNRQFVARLRPHSESGKPGNSSGFNLADLDDEFFVYWYDVHVFCISDGLQLSHLPDTNEEKVDPPIIHTRTVPFSHFVEDKYRIEVKGERKTLEVSGLVALQKMGLKVTDDEDNPKIAVKMSMEDSTEVPHQVAELLANRIDRPVTSIIWSFYGETKQLLNVICLIKSPFSCVQELTLGHANISWAAVSDMLLYNMSLRKFVCQDGIVVGKRGCKELVKALSANSTLREIRFLSSNVDSHVCGQLSSCLPLNLGLRTLDLTKNPIGGRGLSRLADALRMGSRLKELILDEVSTSSKGLTFARLGPEEEAGFLNFCEALSKEKVQLNKLSLRGNYLTADDIRLLLHSVYKNMRGIKMLDLSGNSDCIKKDKGVAVLASFLESRMELKMDELETFSETQLKADSPIFRPVRVENPGQTRRGNLFDDAEWSPSGYARPVSWHGAAADSVSWHGAAADWAEERPPLSASTPNTFQDTHWTGQRESYAYGDRHLARVEMLARLRGRQPDIFRQEHDDNDWSYTSYLLGPTRQQESDYGYGSSYYSDDATPKGVAVGEIPSQSWNGTAALQPFTPPQRRTSSLDFNFSLATNRVEPRSTEYEDALAQRNSSINQRVSGDFSDALDSPPLRASTLYTNTGSYTL